MRASLLAAVVLLLVPGRASATAIPIYAYSFDVIASSGSILTRADGTNVDIGNVLFTATGIATDEPAFDPAFPTVYKATTTYQFGDLGTYRTEEGRDTFWIFDDFIGLGHWNPIDWAGFGVGHIPIYPYGSSNTAGQALYLYVGFFGEPGHLQYVAPRVTAYDVRPVPEPATLLLLGIGVAALAAPRRLERT